LDSRAVKHFFFGGNGGGWLGKNAQGLFRKDEGIFKKAFDVLGKTDRYHQFINSSVHQLRKTLKSMFLNLLYIINFIIG
jgi:hypothetical protein